MIPEELIKLAGYHFKLQLPVSSVALKKAYKKRCLELHPDIGGCDIDFKDMQKAYEVITGSQYVRDVFSEESEFQDVAITIDGTPLSKLGLGLGPVNGSDCPECEHKGYVHHFTGHVVNCEKCGGGKKVPLVEICRSCGGSGKFTQARSRRVVDCLRCNGTGAFKSKRKTECTECTDCGGTGGVWKYSSEPVYVVCRKCNGKGELPMWNPVLLKSALKG